jgi:signal transduction histidine kinase
MKLRLTLHTWLVGSHLVVLSLPLLAVVGTGALSWDLGNQTKEDLEHQGAILALLAEPLMDRPERLSPLLREVKAETLAGIRVVDREGVVVASSGDGVGDDVSEDEEVRAALTGIEGMAIRPRGRTRAYREPLSSPSRHSAVRIYLAVPVSRGDELLGAVLLSRTPREELQTLYQMAPRLWWGAASAVLFTAGLALAAGHYGSRSLRTLQATCERIAGGSLDADLAGPASSRIAETAGLAASMGTMVARLRARLAYIREFAGNVSHEFKTPVAALRGSLELVRDDDAMPREQRIRFLDNALADLDRLSRLVGGLLRLARAEEAGGRSLLTLGALAREVAARHGVEFVGDASSIQANAEQVETAIDNLVQNALRHGGPPVVVRAWREGRWTGVDVTDAGPGVSEANAARVFDRFFTTDRERGGTGLGLALVRAIAEAHGGTASLVPTPSGACFRVAFPVG